MFRSGERTTAATRAGSPDAIVVITGYQGFWVREEQGGRAQIEGGGFRHRTITMTYGQRLEVKNFTDQFWTPELEPKSPAR